MIFDINAGSMPSCLVSKIEDAAAGYTVCDAAWCGSDDLLSAGDDYCIKMWDARKSGASGAPLASYMGHTSCVRSLPRFAYQDFRICFHWQFCFSLTGLDFSPSKKNSRSFMYCNYIAHCSLLVAYLVMRLSRLPAVSIAGIHWRWLCCFREAFSFSRYLMISCFFVFSSPSRRNTSLEPFLVWGLPCIKCMRKELVTTSLFNHGFSKICPTTAAM